MAWFRLARTLGYANVSKLQSEISSHQFLEWQCFNNIDPPMEVKMELYLARLIYTLVSVNHVKGPQPKLEDFMFDWDNHPQDDEVSFKQLKKSFKQFANNQNQKVRKEKEKEQKKKNHTKRPRPVKKPRV